MIKSIGAQNNYNNNVVMHASFGKEQEDKRSKCENHDKLLIKEKTKHPVTTAIKIQADKLANAFTKYPKKGFMGSKNANFYEFLTMGMVPYILGSGMLIGVFNIATKYFDNEAARNAYRIGKKMGLGVLAYGVFKTLSKKLIEIPVKMVRNVDVNLPYDKVVYELPENNNKDNLVSHEYHKVFESVDFPRFDLLYNNKDLGEERDSYYKKTAKKFGFSEEDIEHADQKVKPKIRETVVKTRLFTTLSSYLWAATGVGIAMQEPWESLLISPKIRLRNYKQVLKHAKEKGPNVCKYSYFYQDFGKRFVKSCKEFFNNERKSVRYAGRALLGAAVGMTILGNIFALCDFNKDKSSKKQASTSLIDDSKEKVIC